MGLNKTYQEKAHLLIPAGAHTYSRADDQYPSNAPPILARGKDCYVWDAEGNKYLDYGMALRAVTIGYDFERVSRAAIQEIHKGNNLTRASVTEVNAAEALVNLIPFADMVKFAKNGSTVTSAAVKLSRAHTGRKYVARCVNHPFFSFDDWFIGNTVMSAGVPEEVRALTRHFSFNDISSLERLFSELPDQIACVIMEPATAEEPRPAQELGSGKNFLHQVQNLCKRNGAVFILDEMITGFRWDIRGACKYYGIEPDLVAYGKGMGNGFSVAALAGKREIMELGGIHHKKERVFLISTTHGAEMMGLGAFLEVLKVYEEMDITANLWKIGRRLADGINSICLELGIQDFFEVTGPLCSPVYVARDREKNVSLEYRTLFSQEMIKGGVFMPWISIAHMHGGDAEINLTLDAARKSLAVYSKALENGVQDYLVGPAVKPVFRKFN
ncbi:MAG: glutamate-1-semialdehyde 2,1-aminomutase [Bdellovibrionales bacterium]|nr:glutamate-1-semialdehyde 2,1-aminomutase [Bdellovibrionales bacterium]